MEKIIYRFKEARKMKGLSLRKAAKGFGKSHEWLNKIEQGKIKVDSRILCDFANFYGLKPDYFLPNSNRPKIEFGEIHICKINKYY